MDLGSGQSAHGRGQIRVFRKPWSALDLWFPSYARFISFNFRSLVVLFLYGTAIPGRTPATRSWNPFLSLSSSSRLQSSLSALSQSLFCEQVYSKAHYSQNALKLSKSTRPKAVELAQSTALGFSISMSPSQLSERSWFISSTISRTSLYSGPWWLTSIALWEKLSAIECMVREQSWMERPGIWEYQLLMSLCLTTSM